MEEMLMTYLVENCAIVVPVLWCIGAALKRTPKVADWLIPYLLGGAGIALCLAITLTTGGNAVDGIMQGIITAGVAVYGNQLVKQLKSKEEN